jgi:hypothetical protein
LIAARCASLGACANAGVASANVAARSSEAVIVVLFISNQFPFLSEAAASCDAKRWVSKRERIFFRFRAAQQADYARHC